MQALGFDSYMEFLQLYLKKYRQSVKPTKTTGGGGGGGDRSSSAASAHGEKGAGHKRGRKVRKRLQLHA